VEAALSSVRSTTYGGASKAASFAISLLRQIASDDRNDLLATLAVVG